MLAEARLDGWMRYVPTRRIVPGGSLSRSSSLESEKAWRQVAMMAVFAEVLAVGMVGEHSRLRMNWLVSPVHCVKIDNSDDLSESTKDVQLNKTSTKAGLKFPAEKPVC